MKKPQDPLDLIDPRRFDAKAICDRLNEFDELTEAESETYLGIWEYAGLDEAEHLLGMLLHESHNGTFVVRDLDGALVLLWEELPTGRWHMGPLFRGHLCHPDDSPTEGAAELDTDLVHAVILSLPGSSGPLVSF